MIKKQSSSDIEAPATALAVPREGSERCCDRTAWPTQPSRAA
jgi:hypothetical protein